MSDTTITNFFEQDHSRLDTLLKSFQATKGKDLGKAKEFFHQFNSGLKRHIIWEEEILFPIFEQKTGMVAVGPTEVMRMEHRLIKEALEEIHEKLSRQDFHSEAAEEKLVSVLSLHNQKEENVLYPTMDRILSSSEREEVLRKVLALSA